MNEFILHLVGVHRIGVGAHTCKSITIDKCFHHRKNERSKEKGIRGKK